MMGGIVPYCIHIALIRVSSYIYRECITPISCKLIQISAPPNFFFFHEYWHEMCSVLKLVQIVAQLKT